MLNRQAGGTVKSASLAENAAMVGPHAYSLLSLRLHSQLLHGEQGRGCPGSLSLPHL